MVKLGYSIITASLGGFQVICSHDIGRIEAGLCAEFRFLGIGKLTIGCAIRCIVFYGDDVTYLVIVLSIIVGMILLSVILPLMGIMTTIG